MARFGFFLMYTIFSSLTMCLHGVNRQLCVTYVTLLPNDYYPLIGGDGDKLIELEEIREKHCLHDRVNLLGLVQHEHVQKVDSYLSS